MKQLHKPAIVQQELQKVALLSDKLGRPIDEGIRLTVAALRVHNFVTSQSCEGHLERKTAGPWVDIESPDAQRLLKIMQDGAHSGPEFMKNRAVLVKANRLEQDRLLALLRKFYQSHHSSYSVLLTITESGPGWGRLCPHAGRFMQLSNHDNEYTQWLQVAQAEMSDFTEFLYLRLS
jgi:hypothetical protein